MHMVDYSAFMPKDRRLSITLLDQPYGEQTFLLTSVSGTEGISSLYDYDLKLLSRSQKIDYQKMAGERVTILH